MLIYYILFFRSGDAGYTYIDASNVNLPAINPEEYNIEPLSVQQIIENMVKKLSKDQLFLMAQGNARIVMKKYFHIFRLAVSMDYYWNNSGASVVDHFAKICIQMGTQLDDAMQFLQQVRL